MPLDLEDLRLLLQVVSDGSVQSAATRLGLSRTTIRRRLDDLEASVGAPVLLLGPTGVRLTAAGELITRQGRSLLAQAETLLAQAKATEHGGPTIIRLITPVGMPLLTRLLSLRTLSATHPSVQLDVREREEPLAHVDEPFDLMLHYGPRHARTSWFSRILARVPLAVMAAPQYLARAGTPRTLAELARHRILMWRRGDSPVDAWPLRQGGSIPVSPWLVSSSPMLLRAACRHAEGLLLIPTVTPPGEPGEDLLVPVLEDLVGDELILRTLSPQPSTVDSRVRTILANIESLLHPELLGRAAPPSSPPAGHAPRDQSRHEGSDA
ncbi:MAG: LysR family transcriptional regulator [Myxococcales bacterium]|nr:LysR family transcriptional regulator [Myxococcales bacterium]